MPRGNQDEDGFSLVELVIAMFLLAVLSLAVLPLFVGTTRLSAQNRSELSATAFAGDRLATIQAAYPSTPGDDSTSCGALRALQNQAPVADAASGYASRITVGACPTAYPGSVSVTVTVLDGGAEVASVATRVRVGTS